MGFEPNIHQDEGLRHGLKLTPSDKNSVYAQKDGHRVHPKGYSLFFHKTRGIENGLFILGSRFFFKVEAILLVHATNV
jgi:hypothetical protein